jgi:hypothetical protein
MTLRSAIFGVSQFIKHSTACVCCPYPVRCDACPRAFRCCATQCVLSAAMVPAALLGQPAHLAWRAAANRNAVTTQGIGGRLQLRRNTCLLSYSQSASKPVATLELLAPSEQQQLLPNNEILPDSLPSGCVVATQQPLGNSSPSEPLESSTLAPTKDSALKRYID